MTGGQSPARRGEQPAPMLTHQSYLTRQRGAGSAAGCDLCCGQSVDTGRMCVALGVDKPERRGSPQVESSGEERCHLSAGYRIVGAVPGRAACATRRDSQLGEAFHIRRPPLIGVNIGETGIGPNRIGAVEDPDQPTPPSPNASADRRGRTLLERTKCPPAHPSPLAPQPRPGEDPPHQGPRTRPGLQQN